VDILLSITIFLAFGAGFVLVNLLVGAIVRPHAPTKEKLSIYECGEPTIGSSWVQFDLRFYVVALFFLIFDVEVALIWPIAIVYQKYMDPALIAGGIFLAIIIVGFIYEWYSGSLDWIRSSVNTSLGRAEIGGLSGARMGQYVGTSRDMEALARRDPEALDDERERLAPSDREDDFAGASSS